MEKYTIDDSRTPKVLTCGHTFCSYCVQMSQGASPGQVRCPTCRVLMPADQVKVNFALRDAIAAAGGADSSNSAMPDASQRPARVARQLTMPNADEIEVALTTGAMPQNPELLKVCVGEALMGNAFHADNLDVLVSIQPPEGSLRCPVDICCIVDVSDSMATEATTQDGSGTNVSYGLAILDLVRHAIRTIIKNLEDCDRLAILSFANKAVLVLELTPMNEAGRRDAEIRLGHLQTDGMTNLWQGLKEGIELLTNAAAPGRLQHVMLLTDGIPNFNPPRGIIPMLKRMKEKAPDKSLSCTLSTFGFGYDLDSELLSEIAKVGCGSYSFIPDGGFVGTVFVNAMTNLLLTMAKNVTVTLQPVNGATLVLVSKEKDNEIGPVLGNLPAVDLGGDKGLQIDMGTLQFGQFRDTLVRVKVPAAARGGEWLRVTLQYQTRAGPGVEERTDVLKGQPSAENPEAFEVQRIRTSVVDCIRQAMRAAKQNNLDKMQKKASPLPIAQALVKDLDNAISTTSVTGDEEVAAILEDIHGQVAGAFSREEWYIKWGVHYLPSLMTAHLMQQCNNFKDPGVQKYGGALFQDLRDKADEIFLSLPPPVASARPANRPGRSTGYDDAYSAMRSSNSTTGGAPGTRQAQPQVTMAAYYDRYAGCIDGDATVSLPAGGSKRIADLRRGDLVCTGCRDDSASETRKVQCVVRTRAPEGKFLLVQLPGGLRLTPYHPVLLEGAWRFPADVEGASPAQEFECEAVFTIVLQGGGALLVEQVPCASLGHGISEGAARHPYFGNSQTVLEDLVRFDTFKDGLVDLLPGSAQRDPQTGFVCGLSPHF